MRINRYNNDPIPQLQDTLIGSDSNNSQKKTYNYPIASIVALAVGQIGLGTGSQLLSGGVTHIENFDYEVSDLTYFLNGVYTTSVGGFLTLDPSDASFDRIDIIYANASGLVGVKKGIAAANPVEPILDSTELPLAFVIVKAGATEADVTKVLVYDENAGSPAEWDGVLVNGDLAATTFPYLNLNHIELAQSDVSDASVTFSSATEVNLSDFSVLHLYIAIGDVPLNEDANLVFNLLKDTENVGSFVLNQNLFGWDTSVALAYQSVIIPKSFFSNLGNSTFNKIEITSKNSNAKISIDNISFSSGVDNIGGISTFLGLLDSFNSYLGRGGQFIKVNTGETGLESVTLSINGKSFNSTGTITLVKEDFPDLVTALADLQTGIDALQVQITNNDTDIATNLSAINTNITNIQANADAIAALHAVATTGDYNDLINKPDIKSVQNEYADIAAMLAGQGSQSNGAFQLVIDASADPTVASGYAYYEYLGTTVGDLTDYRKLSEEESMDFVESPLQIADENGVLQFEVAKNEMLRFEGGKFDAALKKFILPAPSRFVVFIDRDNPSADDATAQFNNPNLPFKTDAGAFDALAAESIGDGFVEIHYLSTSWGYVDSRIANYNVIIYGHKATSGTQYNLNFSNFNFANSKSMVINAPRYQVQLGYNATNYFHSLEVLSKTLYVNSRLAMDGNTLNTIDCGTLNITGVTNAFDMYESILRVREQANLDNTVLIQGANNQFDFHTLDIANGVTLSGANNYGNKFLLRGNLTGSGQLNIGAGWHGGFSHLHFHHCKVDATITNIYLNTALKASALNFYTVTGYIDNPSSPITLSSQYGDQNGVAEITFKDFHGRVDLGGQLNSNSFRFHDAHIHTAGSLFEFGGLDVEDAKDGNNICEFVGFNTIEMDTPDVLIKNQLSAYNVQQWGTLKTNATGEGANVTFQYKTPTDFNAVVGGGDSLLSKSSTIAASRDNLVTDADGLNDCTSATDVIISIDTFANVAVPVGSVLLYRQGSTGKVILQNKGTTAEYGRTYHKDQTIAIWHESTDNWIVLNPPTSINSKTDNEPTGSDQVLNVVSLTQAEYDAFGTPNATTLYIITDAV